MGGGDSANSSPPSDVSPGGGTYPVDSFGNAYNPSWGSSQFGSALGKGLQQIGAGFQNMPVPNFMTAPSSPTGSPYVASADKGQTPGLIPTDNGQNDLLEVLKRLLSSGTGPTGIPMSLQ